MSASLIFFLFFLEAQLIRIHCVDNSSSLKSVISYSIVYTCTLIIERTEYFLFVFVLKRIVEWQTYCMSTRWSRWEYRIWIESVLRLQLLDDLPKQNLVCNSLHMIEACVPKFNTTCVHSWSFVKSWKIFAKILFGSTCKLFFFFIFYFLFFLWKQIVRS